MALFIVTDKRLRRDWRNHLHVLTYDPGGVTGWAHYVVHRQAFIHRKATILGNLLHFSTGNYRGTELEQVLQACAMIRKRRYQSNGAHILSEWRVVTEAFELTQIIGGKELLSPVRIASMMEYAFSQNFQLPLEYQSRSLRTNVTRERAKRWGLWWEGKDSFTAVQHGIVYLRRLKQQSIRKPWELIREPKRSRIPSDLQSM